MSTHYTQIQAIGGNVLEIATNKLAELQDQKDFITNNIDNETNDVASALANRNTVLSIHQQNYIDAILNNAVNEMTPAVPTLAEIKTKQLTTLQAQLDAINAKITSLEAVITELS